MKKEHFEVLLENMTDKIDLVLEGHVALNNKIDNVQQDVNELRQDVNDLRNGVIDLRKENEAAHTTLNKKMLLLLIQLDFVIIEYSKKDLSISRKQDKIPLLEISFSFPLLKRMEGSYKSRRLCRQ